jgi:hypothetical protein
MGTTIDLVLIDQQTVGKRRLHLTVNVKNKWTTNYWRENKFLKDIVTVFGTERVSFLKINDTNEISFLERLTVNISIALAGMLILWTQLFSVLARSFSFVCYLHEI